MPVSIADVRHIAALARLGIDDSQAESLAAELSGILSHMDVLSQVDTGGIPPAAGAGAGGTPLRLDGGEPVVLAVRPEAFAPAMIEGFFAVPRLATHEAGEGGA